MTLNNNQNIFERMAAKNEQANFSNIKPTEKVTTPQSLDEDSSKIEEPNIFEKFANKEKEKEQNKFSFIDTAKDVGEQVFSKGISGIGGAYGNILDTLGLQMKEGETLPGQKAIGDIQSDVLDKINRGENPSLSELMILSDDDVLPTYNRLPTSNQIQKDVQDLTGIGEGKTATGRIAGNAAQFIGEGAATGAGLKSLLSLGAAGGAGQTVREAGGPEWAATGTEIAGSILPSLVSKRLIPTGKGAKGVVNAGRHLGLPEKLIAPLIQGEKKVATLSKIARKGSRTKEVFSKIKEKLGDSYNTIKSSKEAKVKLPNADQIKLRKDFGQIRNDLSKTLAPSPDKEAALNYIEKSLDTLRNVDITPEYLVNFWQDINKAVKWNSISGGKKALAQLKDPISNILHNASPKLAKDFEMTNKLYTKYAQISKHLKPEKIDAYINKGELLAAPYAGLALAQGNPMSLIGLASESSLRLLGREMLINPYFQNVSKKLVTNFNQSSLKGVTESVKQVQDYMSRKHPNEDWSFLTDVED